MKNVETWLSRQVEQHKTPSIQYAFFNSAETIYAYRFGWRDVAKQLPVQESTSYNLFSITKTFTALAVLQLAQDGKLDLQRPVTEYLPDFPYTNKITVHQLLTHTAGIPNPMPLRWTHLTNEHADFDADKFFKEIFRKKNRLKSAPGARFRYSNLGYVLLGQLIAKVSEQDYASFIRERIFQRVGITSENLSFEIDPDIHAIGYHKNWSFSNVLLRFLIDKSKFMDKPQGIWQPFRLFYPNGAAYGGMVGTAKGLIQYAQVLLKNDESLLSTKYKQVLFTQTSAGGKPCNMATSWFTGSFNGHRYFTHAGGGGGYYIELRLYPEAGMGSVILFNRSGMRDERILDKADCFFLPSKK
jgi:CubicO group peptidase (beta-lactamase class C family)